MLDCYIRIGKNNASYRTLQSPFRLIDVSVKFGRYSTIPSLPFEIDDGAQVRVYLPKEDNFGIGKLSEDISRYNNDLITYNKETLEIIKNLTVTAQSVVTTVGLAVAIIALLVSAVISVLAALIPLIFG
ncbi:hypothetical protein DAETH_06660 [Deinococcus aetherius]|uniref:Uncharacterized protein n=2 Tax=Deinococcus aetherius TaxID=200252 RepID=A0ABN6RBG1_9DEIO|nr:hypothetical protein DAETH_06660 [Deinococcus aetherius]